MTDLIKTLILGVVEGLTEFLPVSSTGHLKLADHWMGPVVDETFANSFEIFIQIGAIAAVVVYFRRRIMQLLTGKSEPPLSGFEHPGTEAKPDRMHAIWMIILGTLPLGIGYFAAKKSDHYQEAHPEVVPMMIAIALLIGGIIMIAIELLRPVVTTKSMEKMTWKQALVVGCCQILAAVFPGTSRSASTIMPGLLAGLNRETSAEYSFFLAIPAMCAACGIKLLKFAKEHHPADQWMLLMIGTIVSFLVAWVVIAGFMGYIRRHNFIAFGIYRILIAIVVFLAMHG